MRIPLNFFVSQIWTKRLHSWKKSFLQKLAVQLNDGTYFINKRNQYYGLPVVLLPIKIQVKINRVKINYWRVHINHQTLISKKCLLVTYNEIWLIIVQEYLLARVIIGEFVCEKQLADFILAIWATTSIFSIGKFIIGEFSEKLPIVNINSSPINRVVRYVKIIIMKVSITTNKWESNSICHI